MILVDLERVAARRPDRPLFEDLSLTLQTGGRLGVVGRNGTGKSKLLRIVAGAEGSEEGTVRRGRNVRVGFLSQRPALPAGEVRSAVGQHWEAAVILERLGMGGLVDADVATLSGGQAKRVALARVLVDEVDLLVLDEPTNHLDIDAIAWLEDRLARFRGGLVVVTHDRHVLDRVSTRILELDRGRGYVHDGGYGAYLEAAAERVEREANAESVRRNLARAELAWLRRGAPARTRKPKARIAAATAIVEGRGPAADRAGNLDLAGGGQWGATPRLGDKVVDLHGVGHHFGTGAPLFQSLDLDLGPGERLGLVGANGTGKSTLLDISPAASLPRWDGWRRGRRCVSVITTRPAGTSIPLSGYEKRSLAPRASPTGSRSASWSGSGSTPMPSGRRWARSRAASSAGSNCCWCWPDCPTSCCSTSPATISTSTPSGCWRTTSVVVSHDRAFLERTVEDVLVLDGDGGAALAPGGYAGYAKDRPSAGARGTAPTVGATPPSPSAGAPPGPTADDGDRNRGRVASATKVRSASTVNRLLERAEREMATLEEERDCLASKLSAGISNPGHLNELSHALADAQARLGEVEERWLALAEELGR